MRPFLSNEKRSHRFLSGNETLNQQFPFLSFFPILLFYFVLLFCLFVSLFVCLLDCLLVYLFIFRWIVFGSHGCSRPEM